MKSEEFAAAANNFQFSIFNFQFTKVNLYLRFARLLVTRPAQCTTFVSMKAQSGISQCSTVSEPLADESSYWIEDAHKDLGKGSQ